MHARLFFGMLPRIPALLKRRRQTHWSSVGERKGLLGMRFMLAVYRLLGRGAFTLFLWPVIAFTGLPAARSARRRRRGCDR